ncbi:MAG: hypothetical protein GY940_37970 [bacterium]|nr:hypothetical protein [bacterium]
MSITSQVISSYLDSSQIVFDNIDKVPNFKETMLVVGFNDERYKDGTDSLAETQILYLNYLKKQDERKKQRVIVGDTFNDAVRELSNYRQTLRRQFYNDTQLKAELGLKGIMFRRGPRFVDQATNFYDVCKTSAYVKAKLEGIQITTEMIEESIKGIDELQEARSDFEQVKGECQSVRELRDKAFRKLKAWMGAFKKNAEYVYVDNLQELERLNIFERNAPRKVKKTEPEPTGTDTTGTTDTTTTTDTTGTTDTTTTTDATSTTTAPETTTTPGTKEPTQSTQSSESTQPTQPTQPTEPTIQTETGTNG